LFLDPAQASNCFGVTFFNLADLAGIEKAFSKFLLPRLPP